MVVTIKRCADFLLRPLGLKLIRRSSDVLTMSQGLQRIKQHNISIKSIIDIGASDGKWSTLAMKCFPECRTHAIEPLKERESALELLKQEEGQFDYDLCVAGESNKEQVCLNVSDDLDGSTVAGRGGTNRYVVQKTIDQIVLTRRVKGPFLIKFDTHGYEVPILEGAKKTLNNTNIIIMEMYNYKITNSALRFHQMCSYMEKLGFRCFDIVDPMLRVYDLSFWQFDMFFLQN